MKNLLTILSLAAIVMLTAGCQSEKINKLKLALEEANKQCPMDMGEIGQMSSIEFDDDAMEVQFHYTINEDALSIDELKKTSNETARDQLKLLFSREENKKMLDQMIDAEVGLGAIYKGDSSGETLKVTLSLDDLKEIKDNPMSETEINRQLLKNMITQENKLYPTNIESGMDIIRSYDDGDYLVYDICIEEETYDFVLCKDAVESGEAKANISTSFADPMIKRIFKIIVPLEKGLKYHYYGSKTGESFDVTFTPDELNRYM